MPIRVAQENLPCTIRPLLHRTKLRTRLFQMFLPCRQVIHPQREMISALNQCHRPAPADEMQFLLRAQPEPCARKIERRARQRFKPQHIAIEGAAPFHVRDVDATR